MPHVVLAESGTALTKSTGYTFAAKSERVSAGSKSMHDKCMGMCKVPANGRQHARTYPVTLG